MNPNGMNSLLSSSKHYLGLAACIATGLGMVGTPKIPVLNDMVCLFQPYRYTKMSNIVLSRQSYDVFFIERQFILL